MGPWAVGGGRWVVGGGWWVVGWCRGARAVAHTTATSLTPSTPLHGVRFVLIDTTQAHTTIVSMRNITLSAREEVIERARAVAQEQHTTLNQMFRDWLQTVDHGSKRSGSYRNFMQRVGKRVAVGTRKLSREEMNER